MVIFCFFTRNLVPSVRARETKCYASAVRFWTGLADERKRKIFFGHRWIRPRIGFPGGHIVTSDFCETHSPTDSKRVLSPPFTQSVLDAIYIYPIRTRKMFRRYPNFASTIMFSKNGVYENPSPPPTNYYRADMSLIRWPRETLTTVKAILLDRFIRFRIKGIFCFFVIREPARLSAKIFTNEFRADVFEIISIHVSQKPNVNFQTVTNMYYERFYGTIINRRKRSSDAYH